MRYFLSLFLCIYAFINASTNYVTTPLMGQWGNQLFQIAAAYAYALDYDAELLLPCLTTDFSNNIPFNAQKVFLKKISNAPLPAPPALQWSEPNFNYQKIPHSNRTSIFGYFQSDKYFKHRRKEILDLFSAPIEIKERLLAKYPFLASDVLTVGVQIRDYRHEQPQENFHPTKKRAYYEKAMSHFPDDAIFIVSSNNPTLAKECVEGLKPNIIFLQEADYIEEFYALTLCSSFIISNSSFGWWASWLSTKPNKKIIAPYQWFSLPYNNEQMVKDLFPEDFILVYE